MSCQGCAKWIMARVTAYEDGSTITTFKAPDGLGHCEALGIDTAPDFHCAKFEEAGPGLSHAIVTQKPGAPWQHWVMIACPDCGGKGSQNDRKDDRCAGTGSVRKYDDGYIGDERTRRHPMESQAKPKCVACGQEVEAIWKACPACGHRREIVSMTVTVSDRDAGLPVPEAAK